jgi:hypothetical protein
VSTNAGEAQSSTNRRSGVLAAVHRNRIFWLASAGTADPLTQPCASLAIGATTSAAKAGNAPVAAPQRTKRESEES